MRAVPNVNTATYFVTVLLWAAEVNCTFGLKKWSSKLEGCMSDTYSLQTMCEGRR